MHIEINTEDLNRHDALSLAVLIHTIFPDVLGQISLMANASHAALNVSLTGDANLFEDAAQVFGGEGAPSAVARSAEEVFARPPAGAPSAEGSQLDSSADINPGSATLTTASLSDGRPAVDADGLPWDARINSGGGAQNKDGRWKKKAGVGADTIAAVQAELRAALAAGVAVAAEVPPPPPVTAAEVPPPPPTAAPAPPPVAAAEVPAPLPPEVIAAAQTAALTRTGAFAEGQAPAAIFTGVMRHITDGKFTPEEIGQACVAVGIATPREIMAKPAIAGDFVATLDDLRAGASAGA